MEASRLLPIAEDIYIVDPWPAVYIESLDTLVLADLHLGVEGALEKEGIFLPLNVSLIVSKYVEEALEDSKASRLLLLGDVKHEFGFPNPSEWIEVKKLLNGLLARRIRVAVIRGNHDNYLISILRRLNTPIHQTHLNLDKYSFVHGHLPLKTEEMGEVIFMGHEHPSVRIRAETGVTHKFKCFLVGDLRGKMLIVLPASNELAGGVDVNVASPSEFLSPILRGCDLGLFTPYLLDPGHAVHRFPQLKFLGTMSYGRA
ncbi:MAG: metallophosphoesterase [Candidatus Geothermarchaeales archaeon]